ncbi:yippee zinc-binding/DNA-binding /Mis18, centromere assembly-domain-containing protein [Yarrowia lipolytica]|uniref:Protein yippee-like n=1 Tax=Yarrowia lipolytica TaxID=4952 RepID=A0A371C8H0_YARLL|nr:yippee zinc-binding/DNA-binding /Mis18, centromere assembly-domain-containing protein [Yarrowia lipolytica]KAE8170878.1 yippee zinc-binding/DNA-binding /Mis18, centromere assembly-domain-containing protein [Yarrowia lipolytica]RDW26603.1 yippee zinc-binding/DNA-binding /Mis18, centromere assembly-domain-containing protein [Yarrowia lipolytica]RDW29313.1 yippee zinc-binding/DNA-binding /Mis18, centromere assembly-domain-containing protein [Yarrowia lipolytica]RDW36147.1 yippee zinc-binding/DN
MGFRYTEYLDGQVYRCKKCGQHLTTHDDLMSKSFKGAMGTAYLFKKVVNIQEHEVVEKEMTTGKHLVCDITCGECTTTLGWKYIKAFEKQEKYKEDKYILEKYFMTAPRLSQQRPSGTLRLNLTAIEPTKRPFYFFLVCSS